MIRLSPRLQAIASLIPRGARVLDVGTDHASLPIWLLQTGVTASVCATEYNERPYQKAEANLRRCGLLDRVTLLRRDGLQDLPLRSFDVAVLAGLSGETLIGIIKAVTLLPKLTLLLQPMSHAQRLRAFLFENGYDILKETLFETHLPGVRQIDTIMSVRASDAAQGKDDAPAHHLWSNALLASGDPLLPRYASQIEHRLLHELKAVAASQKPGDAIRRFQLEEDLRCLRAEILRMDEDFFVPPPQAGEQR